MKFNKTNWERKTPTIRMSESLLYEMVKPVFPNKKIESFVMIPHGLANNNVRFKFTDQNDFFLLRIYTRDRNAINQEVALGKRFGKHIPMPEFLYVDRGSSGYAYAIQRWLDGKPLHEMLNLCSSSQTQKIAEEIANSLNLIASESLEKGGYFKEDLTIIPFESENQLHPFVSYIKDCLNEGYAGRWLGDSFKEAVWKYVLDNQIYFPSLEPACLVHGDFNPDNILIDEKSLKVAGILDWEFAFSGSYLFDVGTLLRFEVSAEFENTFIKAYQEGSKIQFPPEWRKIIKIQDLSNLIGMMNTPHERPNLIQDVKTLVQNIMTGF